jgi:hypothetical protein
LLGAAGGRRGFFSSFFLPSESTLKTLKAGWFDANSTRRKEDWNSGAATGSWAAANVKVERTNMRNANRFSMNLSILLMMTNCGQECWQTLK